RAGPAGEGLLRRASPSPRSGPRATDQDALRDVLPPDLAERGGEPRCDSPEAASDDPSGPEAWTEGRVRSASPRRVLGRLCPQRARPRPTGISAATLPRDR